MIYRENCRNQDKISQLAFGCMRLKKDKQEAAKQLFYAIEQGINYFDTAYIYPGNEALIGSILGQSSIRNKIFIATKLPTYLIKKSSDFDRILATELKRLQTDYIDYYLMHMLIDSNDWRRMCSLGIEDWLAKQQAAGTIKNVGFSYHGGRDQFQEIIKMRSWDFCMIQFNYLDKYYQAGLDGLNFAASNNVPVMVMEPLRGGALVNKLPPKAADLLKEHGQGQTAAEWALRWVWDYPQVLTVLSGMSSMEMISENVQIASQAKPQALKPEILNIYEQMREIIQENILVPCTSCNYCMPCPQGVDIPQCFNLYNDNIFNSKFKNIANYATRIGDNYASRCNLCGSCEMHCPQKLPIRKHLAEIKQNLECFPYQQIRFIQRRLFQGRK